MGVKGKPLNIEDVRVRNMKIRNPKGFDKLTSLSPVEGQAPNSYKQNRKRRLTGKAISMCLEHSNLGF